MATGHYELVEGGRAVGFRQLSRAARAHLEEQGVDVHQARGVFFGGEAPHISRDVSGVLLKAHRLIREANRARVHKIYSVNAGTAGGLAAQAQGAASSNGVFSIGVFPKDAVVLSKGKEEEKLAENDLHLAVPGRESGDEREQVLRLASVGFFTNGGVGTGREVQGLLERGGSVYLIEGSGRFAGQAAEMLRRGRVHAELRGMLEELPGLEGKLRREWENGRVFIVVPHPSGAMERTRVLFRKARRIYNNLFRSVFGTQLRYF